MPAGTVLHLACHHRRYLFGTDDSVPAFSSCVPCRTWLVDVVDYRDAIVGVDVHGPDCRVDSERGKGYPQRFECICGLKQAQDDAERELLLGHD